MSKQHSEPSAIIPLWPGGAPGSEGWDWPEVEQLQPEEKQTLVWNVTQPSLMAYLPDPAIANGTAVIICPGGAFHFVVVDREGWDVAHWLNARGAAAFVLKYRLAHTGADPMGELHERLGDRNKMAELMKPLRPMITADGQQAVRLVREHAGDWGIRSDRIGIMGFSAGGTVTSNVALQYDAASRPDFAAPIYSAGFFDAPVPADAPPLFLLCAGDDQMAVTNSLKLFSDWRAASRPAEMHIYAKGGHGFSSRTQGLPCDSWLDRFGDWLHSGGWL